MYSSTLQNTGQVALIISCIHVMRKAGVRSRLCIVFKLKAPWRPLNIMHMQNLFLCNPMSMDSPDLFNISFVRVHNHKTGDNATCPVRISQISVQNNGFSVIYPTTIVLVMKLNLRLESRWYLIINEFGKLNVIALFFSCQPLTKCYL